MFSWFSFLLNWNVLSTSVGKSVPLPLSSFFVVFGVIVNNEDCGRCNWGICGGGKVVTFQWLVSYLGFLAACDGVLVSASCEEEIDNFLDSGVDLIVERPLSIRSAHPVCELACLTKASALANFLPHLPHPYGFSPV
ncbi:hypothetical protein WICPIJ_000907 [Wickerhamomyces pijperi]|uniref:Gfo/Idh/MocA-like oxidoreductase N-terminal domain-containing protein n=1 Tax=Wickerhamomyces pijperi TaxID=599730 RepID=A0A9P8QCW7_WICPI|nr:hypothetical protein WICPIJ_000907 [Wickerhamomyces pijperi]